MRNRGMFLEELINKTNKFYINKGLAFVQKRFTKVHIAKINGNKVNGFLGSKNYVDYFGFKGGKHFEFETKSCKGEKFYFKNIKNEQLSFLQNVDSLGAPAFFIIHFSSHNKFFYITVKEITKHIKEGNKSLSIDVANKKGQEIKVSYPGILNYLDLIIFYH